MVLMIFLFLYPAHYEQSFAVAEYQIVTPFLAMLGAYFESAYFEITSFVLFVYLLVNFILFIESIFFLKN
jgi:hypothetical protein